MNRSSCGRQRESLKVGVEGRRFPGKSWGRVPSSGPLGQAKWLSLYMTESAESV